MNQQQNAMLLARALAVSLVGKSQAWNLVKHRKCLNILSLTLILLPIIGVFFGCTSKPGIPAEISLQRSEFIKIKDLDSITSYQNDYLDTNIVWMEVAKSMKRDTACNVLMYDYDTVVIVRGLNGIEASFKYTVLPSDTGKGTPIWASSGVAFDTSRRGFACYSIDDRLYLKMLSRIRSTAKCHPDKLIRAQRFRRTHNVLDEITNDTSKDVSQSDPNLSDKMLGLK